MLKVFWSDTGMKVVNEDEVLIARDNGELLPEYGIEVLSDQAPTGPLVIKVDNKQIIAICQCHCTGNGNLCDGSHNKCKQ